MVAQLTDRFAAVLRGGRGTFYEVKIRNAGDSFNDIGFRALYGAVRGIGAKHPVKLQ
jgi:hypothetical protein